MFRQPTQVEIDYIRPYLDSEEIENIQIADCLLEHVCPDIDYYSVGQNPNYIKVASRNWLNPTVYYSHNYVSSQKYFPFCKVVMTNGDIVCCAYQTTFYAEQKGITWMRNVGGFETPSGNFKPYYYPAYLVKYTTNIEDFVIINPYLQWRQNIFIQPTQQEYSYIMQYLTNNHMPSFDKLSNSFINLQNFFINLLNGTVQNNVNDLSFELTNCSILNIFYRNNAPNFHPCMSNQEPIANILLPTGENLLAAFIKTPNFQTVNLNSNNIAAYFVQLVNKPECYVLLKTNDNHTNY